MSTIQERTIHINEDWTNQDLRHLDFTGYTFKHVDFSYSDLTGTRFDNTLCQDCCFIGTTLSSCSFIGADCLGSNFSKANLSDANFYCARLENTQLDSVITTPSTRYFHQKCPENGPFLGFKNCYGERIVQLLIPEDALRSSATNDTCRCSKAKVLSIKSPDLKMTYSEATSYVDDSFIYTVGQYVTVSNFNPDRWVDSTTGIHFFMTRDEAISYM